MARSWNRLQSVLWWYIDLFSGLPQNLHWSDISQSEFKCRKDPRQESKLLLLNSWDDVNSLTCPKLILIYILSFCLLSEVLLFVSVSINMSCVAVRGRYTIYTAEPFMLIHCSQEWVWQWGVTNVKRLKSKLYWLIWFICSGVAAAEAGTGLVSPGSSSAGSSPAPSLRCCFAAGASAGFPESWAGHGMQLS